MSSRLKITPLGGLGEIGMNCMVLEYEDEMIVVDCGVLFSDLDHFGVELVIPDFSYLVERREKLSAYIMTHGHEDHIGALAYALKAGARAPIYASNFTSLLVRHRLEEHGLTDSTELRTFKMGEQIQLKHFKITTVSVNHSIVDAAALIIDTPFGKIIHTGDFKIDPTPFYGHPIDEKVFRKAGEDGVLLLMSDSTNVERHDHANSESKIYQSFEQLFAAAEGLTVIAMFASNVARVGQVFELAKKMGKKVAVAGRSMDQNSRFAQEAGYLKDLPGTMISIDDIGSYDRSKIIVLTSGSQAEPGSALMRAAHGEHKQLDLREGDRVLMSSRYIPGNEKNIGRMINDLFKQGAEVLYEAVHDIHVSGHATRPELKQMIEWTKPKFFLPIHGEYRHLIHHARLAEETGMDPDNVIVAINGDVIELDQNECDVIEHTEEAPKILLGDRSGGDISKTLLKDRRQLAEKGVVFSLLVRDSEYGKIIAGPEIILRGIVNEDKEGFLIEESRALVKKVVAKWEKESRDGSPEYDLEETIRIELRRFFGANIGKKPVVIPILLDV